MTDQQKESLLQLLEQRFEKNMHRHPNMTWKEVLSKIATHEDALISLFKMEDSGGEPDVIEKITSSSKVLYFDCSKESPTQRRSICYDKAAQIARKKYPATNNAEAMAKEFGIELLDESQYRFLQQFEKFDTKTSSWIQTPTKIRDQGGALFAEYRYSNVFLYHNGADSFYATRGFRGYLKV